ncbi:MAG: SUMF1/EgtB/PvdO family nonheme iron enzyme, partial [Bradymonadaceae bacterium]
RFPWGNQFDATFCKMRSSRPETPPQPEPVGAFEDDISPYGVRDLAGGTQEWCRPTDDHGNYCPAKGGGWGQDERLCHLASNVDMLAAARSARIGFRLVYEPDFD